MLRKEQDLKRVEEVITAANNSLQSEIESYIETIQKQLQNAVAFTQSTMNNPILGGDYNKTKERWQEAQKQAEGYYDSVERIYQLKNLQSKLKQLIQQN